MPDARSGIVPARLRCEYEEHPLSLETQHPRFSWELRAEGRDQWQSAYQVLVGYSAAQLGRGNGDLWDSGTVESDDSIHVEYQGRALTSSQACCWAVRVRDGRGHWSPYSATARFEMGLLEPADWGAEWIARHPDAAWSQRWSERKSQEKRAKLNYSAHPVWELYRFHDPSVEPAPLLRRSFRLRAAPAKARLYICGLGYYELRLNGRKVGDHVLDPGITDYDQRVLYATYDVTDRLRSGDNAIAVMLGRGWFSMITHTPWWYFDEANWWGQPRVIAVLKIWDEAGAETVIGTDETWETADGPVVWDCVRAGEIYDARRELDDWDQPRSPAGSWRPAVTSPPPAGQLVAQPLEPIKPMVHLEPVSRRESTPGVALFDMGQNMTGWVRLRLRARAGTRVTISFAELLNAEGDINPTSGAGRYQQAIYFARGGGEEVYEPRFTYYGFQYVRSRAWTTCRKSPISGVCTCTAPSSRSAASSVRTSA